MATATAPGDVYPGRCAEHHDHGADESTLTVNEINGGIWSFGNAASVTYHSIEMVNTIPTGTPYDLILEMEPTLTNRGPDRGLDQRAST